jgi:hypothetical protein
MDPAYVLSLLADDTRWAMASLAGIAPVRSKALALRSLGELFQGVGICKLLVDDDPTAFRENLVRGAQARRYHLRKSHEEGSLDDRFLGLSKTEAIFDAIVAGAPDLVRDIVSLSPTQWNAASEYEDDFCYMLFAHRLATVRGFLVGDEAGALLQRFENALQGQRSDRLNLCRTLSAGDAGAFREAFERFLDQRKVDLDKRRARITEYTAQALFWPRSFVSVEALAWLEFARLQGLPMDDEFLFCPRDARGPHRRRLEVEDFFESLDIALKDE